MSRSHGSASFVASCRFLHQALSKPRARIILIAQLNEKSHSDPGPMYTMRRHPIDSQAIETQTETERERGSKKVSCMLTPRRQQTQREERPRPPNLLSMCIVLVFQQESMRPVIKIVLECSSVELRIIRIISGNSGRGRKRDTISFSTHMPGHGHRGHPRPDTRQVQV